MNSPGGGGGGHLMAEAEPLGVACPLASCPVSGLLLLCHLPGNTLTCWPVLASPQRSCPPLGVPTVQLEDSGRAQGEVSWGYPPNLNLLPPASASRSFMECRGWPTWPRLSFSPPSTPHPHPIPPCTQCDVGPHVWVFMKSPAFPRTMKPRAALGTPGKVASPCFLPAHRESRTGGHWHPRRVEAGLGECQTQVTRWCGVCGPRTHPHVPWAALSTLGVGRGAGERLSFTCSPQLPQNGWGGAYPARP